MKLKFFLLPLIFLMAIVPSVIAPGQITHECGADDALASPLLADSPIANLIKANRGCFDSGYAFTDTTVIYYYSSGGSNYLATHTWAFADKMMSLASNNCEKAFAYGVESHLIMDSISHNYLIPQVITKFPFIPNFPIHLAVEGAYDARIGQDRPECYERARHSLDTFLSSPELIAKAQLAVDSTGGTFDVKQQAQQLSDIMGNPNRFYSEYFHVPNLYQPAVFGDWKIGLIFFSVTALFIFLVIRIDNIFFRIIFSIVIIIMLLLSVMMTFGLMRMYPTAQIDPYYDKEVNEMVKIFQTQYHNERYSYDPSGFEKIRNADAQVIWIWIVFGLVILGILVAIIYRNFR